MSGKPSAGGRISAAVRRAIRLSPDSLRVLARRYGINPKTVAKWKSRDSVDDRPSGPPPARHGRLSAEDVETILRFREHTLLPLDDCLYVLQARIPHLTRSTLHRCLQRHGISRLGDTPGPATDGANREAVPLGWVHVDRSLVWSGEGEHVLFNAIDQASKLVFVRMGRRGDAAAAADFVASLAAHMPFRISRVLTTDSEPFTGDDGFARACRAQGMEHHLTGSPHPWARGQAWARGQGARMGRMLREGVTFPDAAYLASLLGDFVAAHNLRRRLKTLRGHTPHDFICRAWQREPGRFHRDPHHLLPGLEIMPG